MNGNNIWDGPNMGEDDGRDEWEESETGREQTGEVKCSASTVPVGFHSSEAESALRAETPPTMDKEPEETGIAQLHEASKIAQDSDEFIWLIQRNATAPQFDLLGQLYQWERATPERIERFRYTGWFGIATEFFSTTRNK